MLLRLLLIVGTALAAAVSVAPAEETGTSLIRKMTRIHKVNQGVRTADHSSISIVKGQGKRVHAVAESSSVQPAVHWSNQQQGSPSGSRIALANGIEESAAAMNRVRPATSLSPPIKKTASASVPIVRNQHAQAPETPVNIRRSPVRVSASTTRQPIAQASRPEIPKRPVRTDRTSAGRSQPMQITRSGSNAVIPRNHTPMGVSTKQLPLPMATHDATSNPSVAMVMSGKRTVAAADFSGRSTVADHASIVADSHSVKRRRRPASKFTAPEIAGSVPAQVAQSKPTKPNISLAPFEATDARALAANQRRGTQRSITVSSPATKPYVEITKPALPRPKHAIHLSDLNAADKNAVRPTVAQGDPANERNIPLREEEKTPGAELSVEDQLVFLKATKAKLTGVLRMIANYHRLNLVIGPQVEGEVTANFEGATLEEVLDAILGVENFYWHRVGNLLYVTSDQSEKLDPRVQGRRLQVYPLNYVSAEDIEPVITRLLTQIGQSFTAAASEEDQLKSREVLVVEDVDAAHARVAEYLAQVDVMPQQVLIEAHVLQVDLDREERHGINLQAIANVAGADVTVAGTQFATLDAENPQFTLRVNGTDMDSLIEAIRSCTNSRTLASPKVSVVNRQTAKVQIGQRLPYAVATTTQTATIQNVQFLDVGIVLTVTPVITEDGNVLMTVMPKVSGGKINQSGFPEEDTTEVTTTVLLPNGGGMVIGGLIRETAADSKSVVPGLNRIPIVRRFFAKDSTEARRNELVVALVTHVIECSAPARNKELTDLEDALPGYARSELHYQAGLQHGSLELQPINDHEEPLQMRIVE